MRLVPVHVWGLDPSSSSKLRAEAQGARKAPSFVALKLNVPVKQVNETKLLVHICAHNTTCILSRYKRLHLFKACRSWLRMSLPSLGSWRSYSSAQFA